MNNSPATVEATDASLSTERTLALWEIVSLLCSVVLAEWVVFSIGGARNTLLAVTVAIAVGFMFISHRLHGESLREIGWRFDTFLPAVKLLVLPTLIPTVLLIALGVYFSSVNFARWSGGQSILGTPILGLGWGLLQQYALQGFVNRRAQIIWGRGWASIFVVALFFAVLHFPNPWLTFATFAGGLVWAWVYQRAPNLLALGISHGLMTWVLISTIPPSLLYNLRVGFKYFG